MRPLISLNKIRLIKWAIFLPLSKNFNDHEKGEPTGSAIVGCYWQENKIDEDRSGTIVH